MPNTVPAADTGLPKPPITPLDIVDRLNLLRSFVECAWMAATHVGVEDETSALQAVLDHVSTGLKELSEQLESGGSTRDAAEGHDNG